MKNMIFFLLLSAALSCTKEPTPTPLPPVVITPTDTVLQLLWAKKFAGGSTPILYQNQVGLIEYNGGNPDYLVFLDSSTGSEIWRWGQGYPDFLELKEYDRQYLINNHLYFVSSNWRQKVSINLAERKTEWFSETMQGSPRFGVFNDYFYHSHESNWSSSLVRSHVSAPLWDTLYTVVDSVFDPVSLENLSHFVNEQNDTILIFVEGAVNWSDKGRSRATLTGVNVRTKELVFRNVGFEPRGDVNALFSQVVNGKVYILGATTVWCFDANTGQVIWSDNFDPTSGYHNFLGSNGPVIYKDWIIAKSAFNHMKALDLNTGQVAWFSQDGLSASKKLWIYKDKYIIYARYGGGGIAVHRLNDGKLIYQNKKILADAYSGDDLAIDQTTDRIYWSDGINAYCFKLKLP